MNAVELTRIKGLQLFISGTAVQPQLLFVSPFWCCKHVFAARFIADNKDWSDRLMRMVFKACLVEIKSRQAEVL